MKIDVIIPNYNGFLLLKNNLPKVLDAFSSYKNSSIIIVDDGSSKEEFLKLKDYIDSEQKAIKLKIKLIRNEKNLGFSSTVNRGAFESSAELLVFLNSDVAPEKKFLEPILEDFEKDKNLFGVGCLDNSIEGDKVVLRGRGIGKWRRGFMIHYRGEINKRDTFWVSGGSSVVRRDLFVKLGGFDELYNPFYWEDIDLSYRAQKRGFNILFEDKSIVIHRHLEGTIKTNYSGFKVKTIAYRNQFIFIWKNITDLDLFLSHLVWLPYHSIKALLRFDFAYFYGFLAAFLKLPKILSKRRNGSYIKKDKDIIKNYE